MERAAPCRYESAQADPASARGGGMPWSCLPVHGTRRSGCESVARAGHVSAGVTSVAQIVGNFWPGSRRIPVDVEGGLRASWDGAKLLYKTGQPQAALSRICDEASLPIPEPITSGQLAAAGVERRVTMKLPLITSPHDQTASYRSVLLLPGLSLRSHAKVRSRSGHPGAFHQRLPLGSRQHSVQC